MTITYVRVTLNIAEKAEDKNILKIIILVTVYDIIRLPKLNYALPST